MEHRPPPGLISMGVVVLLADGFVIMASFVIPRWQDWFSESRSELCFTAVHNKLNLEWLFVLLLVSFQYYRWLCRSWLLDFLSMISFPSQFCDS